MAHVLQLKGVGTMLGSAGGTGRRMKEGQSKGKNSPSPVCGCRYRVLVSLRIRLRFAPPPLLRVGKRRTSTKAVSLSTSHSFGWSY